MDNRLVGTGTSAQDTRAQTVVIAHSMRMYRDVTAFAFGRLRPRATVINVDPSNLEAATVDVEPVLLICDVCVVPAMRRSSSWILLDNQQPQMSTVSIHGEVWRDVFTDLGLILEVFDHTVRLRKIT